MTIILFLVDTSSSMCQKAYVNGVQKTYLDIAKGAVETFLKYRQRTQDCLGDRYMLLTFEEPPANVKAGWKENHATFMNELKNLQSHGLTSMGESLRNAFDLLNLNRMQSGIDTYGQGRCPFYLEPSVIIVITDGGRYSYRNGVHQEIILPLSNQIPGTKFTKEPFRWDQRLFSLVLRMPGNKIDERVEGKVPHDDSPIERMCEVTGGRSYRVRSHYVLNQCIESLVQKVQPGVVLQFEPLLPKDSASTSGNSTSSSSSGNSASGANSGDTVSDIVFQPIKKMIYVQKHITQKTFPIGYWPLPEPYWPDSKAMLLPPRDAHPKLKIMTPAVDEPQLVRSFPVDKYEIEACPLTLQILNKREMNKCWQVIVTNGMHGFELPFGYLKAAPNFTQVHLYVLAYNYPALLPLLHDLIHKYNMSPPNDLMYKFNAYVRSIPPYYCPFLRKALVNINVPYQLLQFLLPENVDNYLSPTIANQLKHIKNTAKQDQENLCMKVYKQLKAAKPPYRQVETAKLCTGTVLRRDLVRHPLLRDTFAKLHLEIELVENYTIVVPQLTHQASAKTYRNPFDIPRRDLVEEIARMREAFMRPATLVAKDSGHCLPIAEMGNYQEYLKNKDNPLREIEPTNVRQHMFGNPYKKDKHMVMVDEADLSDVAPMKSPNGNGGAGGSGGVSGPGGNGMSGMGGGPGGMSGLMIGGGASGSGGSGSKKLDGTSRGRKRKAGPLPRAFEFRRLSTESRLSTSSSSTAGSATGAESPTLSFDEDSNSSYASSTCSDVSSDSGMSGMHNDRLVFDFNEEESSEQETTLNGYVHNFINGISDDAVASDADLSANGSAAATTSATTTTAAQVTVSGSTPTTASTATCMSANGGISPYEYSAMGASVSSSGLSGSSSSHNNSSGVLYVPLNGLATLPAYSSNLSVSPTDSVIVGMPTVHKPSMLPLVNGYSHLAHLHMPFGTTLTAPMAVTPTSPTSGSAVTPTTAPAVGSASSNTTSSSSTSTSIGSSSTSSSNSNTISSSSSSSSSSSAYFSHNDINDASEISRILQTCHNGNGSSVSSSSSSASSSMLNGSNGEDNGLDSLAWDQPGAAMPNSFDALKRVAGKTTGAGAGSVATPHYYWGSGLNHYNHQSNNNINNHQSNNSNSTSNNSSGAKNPDTKVVTPTYSSNSNSSYNMNSSGNSSISSSINSSTNNNNNNNNDNSSNNNSNNNSSSNSNNNNSIVDAISLALTEEQRDAARKHNVDLRSQIFRDIRRPGRDYSQLLEHLTLVKGDHEMKSDFIDMCIGESMRFRRLQMAGSIQDWWDRNQQQLETTKS